MDIKQFAEKHLGEFKESGNELIVKTCPICKKDKSKFYLNTVTGKYICFSGSCGATGGISKLMQTINVSEDIKTPEGKIASLKTVVSNIKLSGKNYSRVSNFPEHVEYMNRRGISLETLNDNKIMIHKQRKAFSFFLTEGLLEHPSEIETDNKTIVREGKANIVGVKYRTIDKKFSCESGSKSVLLWWDMISDDENTIIIVEGEIDALTLKELGYKNVCSLPFGAKNSDWIDHHEKWLENKTVILGYDNDVAGNEGFKKASKKLKGTVKEIKILDMLHYKDINETYLNSGAATVVEIINNAREISNDDYKDISQVGRFDINDIERFRTGILTLDAMLGGFKSSEAIVIAGDNASGKTTLVTQIMLQAIEQNKKCFMYNGELSESVWKEWLFLQASGQNGIEKVRDNLVGFERYRVSDEYYEKIDKWMDGKIKINTAKKAETGIDIIEKMKTSFLKNNCFLFVIDNFSTVRLDDSKPRAEALGEFLVEIKDFAKEYGVCVIGINHMTKTQGKEMSKDNIRGSKAISDMADTVILVEKEKLKVDKNRFFGKTGEINIQFDEKSRRIYSYKNIDELKFEYSFNLEEEVHLPF